MSRVISIDPVTRVEGHARVNLYLDDGGALEAAKLTVPEFRGFEKFCEGRLADEMPVITAKICGVCPTAHHLASAKALDALYGVTPPPAARVLREMLNCAFFVEDHLLHFYVLGGPDFIVAEDAPPAMRSVLGVAQALGRETVKGVLDFRKRMRDASGIISGSALHPVAAVAGGLSRPVDPEGWLALAAAADEAVDMALAALEVFHDRVETSPRYRAMRADDSLAAPLYSLGMVDRSGGLNFYDGVFSVISPAGELFEQFEPADYARHLIEFEEPDTYAKTLYLSNVGWKGYRGGLDSGAYLVGPVGRLNVARAMSTPLAAKELERYRAHWGGGPVFNPVAFHQARLIESLYAAERMGELARSSPERPGEVLDHSARNVTAGTLSGVGAVEAPRGSLIHRYESDGRGVLGCVDLIVGTQNNQAAIAIALKNCAAAYFGGGAQTDEEGALWAIEAVLRSFDPCFACTTHALGEGGLGVFVHQRGRASRKIS